MGKVCFIHLRGNHFGSSQVGRKLYKLCYPGTQKDTNKNSTVGTKCLWVGDSDNALSLTEQTTLPCLQTCMNCLAFYCTHVYIQMVKAWPKIKVLNIIWGYRRL